MRCSHGFSARSRSVARSGINPMNQNTSEIVREVDTANTSQTSGLRKLGQYRMELGYGKSQHASHGRPVWASGKIPAQATAKSVIASAKRLMELRQVCRSSARMAEINVPAWPMPIHQTKLTMANPQPMGILMPQIPVPLKKRYPRATISMFIIENTIRKPKIHPSEIGRLSTMLLIFSVMVEKVWPGAITGTRLSATGICVFVAMPYALDSSNSGFGLRTSARYVVRGRVFNSASSE